MNETKADGFLDEAKGKIKQAWGDVTGNKTTQAEGAADEVKGHAEQTWGSVKDAAHDQTASTDSHLNHDHDSTTTSHGLRDDITAGAQHLKENVQHGLDNLKHKNDD